MIASLNAAVEAFKFYVKYQNSSDKVHRSIYNSIVHELCEQLIPFKLEKSVRKCGNMNVYTQDIEVIRLSSR